MKAIGAIACFVWMTTLVHADVKWIPIEPISPTETSKPDTNRSKLPHADTLIERVKILQRLMDKGSKNDGDTADKKGWYVLDTMEND